MGCCMSSPSAPSPSTSSDNNHSVQNRQRVHTPSIANSRASSRHSLPITQLQTRQRPTQPSRLDIAPTTSATTNNNSNINPSARTTSQASPSTHDRNSVSARSPHTPLSARRISSQPPSHHATSPLTPGISQVPLSQLRAPRPWRSTSRTWTPRTLSRERAAFFDTRVSGSAEVWAAIRLAVESMREAPAGLGTGLDAGGDPQAEEAMATARGILEAAGVSCPTGRLGDGLWDERGVWYEVPRYVARDPMNIAEDEEIEKEAEEDGDPEKGAVSEGESEGDGTAGGDVTEKETVKVRARLSDRASDVVVRVERDAAVRVVVRRIHEAAKIANDTKIKIAYLGKILKNEESLDAQGWEEKHVVNALVFLRPWETDEDEKGVTASA